MLRAFIFLLLVTVGIVGVAWYYMGDNAAQNKAEEERQADVDKGFLKTAKDFNDKMEEYKRKKDQVQTQIERLEIRKRESTKEFTEMGVTTAVELDKDPVAKRLFTSINEYKASIEKLTEDIKLYDDTISAIELALKDIDHKNLMNEVGVDDKTYATLRTIVKDVDGKLNKPESALEKMEKQSLLDDILGKAKND